MGKHKELITELAVRFRDIDAMGHVNNAVFFTYFEEGRKAFLKEVLGIVELSDYPFILAHLRCDYLKPIKPGDSPCVHLWIGDVGTKKFSFKYKIVDRNQASRLYATGESVMVLFDYKENKTVPIPPDFLEKISEYRE